MNYAIQISLQRLAVFWALTIPIAALMLVSTVSGSPGAL